MPGRGRSRRVALPLLGLGPIAAVLAAIVLVDGRSSRAPEVALPLHPIAGSFAPDDTELRECGDERCVQQALGNVAFRESPKAALALAEEVYGGGGSAACHRATHVIGAAALARYGGDVARTFAEGSSTCWSGYYHGVLERSLLGVRSYEPAALASVARGLCAEAKSSMTPWLAYQCLHGLGHGLMISTGLHLPRSLAVCRRLATAWDASACKGGVFMENQTPSYGVRSRWLRDDDPVYPCNAVARADKYRCYQIVTTRVLPAVGDSWEKTAEVCARVERAFVVTCFESYGRDASTRTDREPSGGRVPGAL